MFPRFPSSLPSNSQEQMQSAPQAQQKGRGVLGWLQTLAPFLLGGGALLASKGRETPSKFSMALGGTAMGMADTMHQRQTEERKQQAEQEKALMDEAHAAAKEMAGLDFDEIAATGLVPASTLAEAKRLSQKHWEGIFGMAGGKAGKGLNRQDLMNMLGTWQAIRAPLMRAQAGVTEDYKAKLAARGKVSQRRYELGETMQAPGAISAALPDMYLGGMDPEQIQNALPRAVGTLQAREAVGNIPVPYQTDQGSVLAHPRDIAALSRAEGTRDYQQGQLQLGEMRILNQAMMNSQRVALGLQALQQRGILGVDRMLNSYLTSLVTAGMIDLEDPASLDRAMSSFEKSVGTTMPAPGVEDRIQYPRFAPMTSGQGKPRSKSTLGGYSYDIVK